MTEEELFDALDGLHAYDAGSVDSGIHDESLRERCKSELRRIIDDGRTENQIVSRKFSEMIARYILRFCLGEKAIAQGYGYEDLVESLRWLQERMGVPS